jgi:RNA polymerase sigma factor (sigma-70 family)
MATQIDDLILAAQAGGEEPLLQLLEVCRPQLQRYADHQCASEDVEEAVQDALWLLYRRIGALRIIGAFSAWLFQIVRRECTRRARKRSHWISFDEGDPATNARKEKFDEDLRIDLSRAISSLPPGYRDIIVLRDINGLTSEEASERLGIPVAAAKSRLHRARQMVRSRLQGKTTLIDGGLSGTREGLCTSATRPSQFTY